MYGIYSKNDKAKRRIQETFARRDSHIGCVVATVTFGMRINVPDVNFVVHWGTLNILDYWQVCWNVFFLAKIGKYIDSRLCVFDTDGNAN